MESLGTLAGCLLMMAAVLATAGLFARFSKFYQRELALTSGREVALDGLRGIAALMVAVHHTAICRTWLETGAWTDAGSFVPQMMGPFGVVLFFMLTGSLFWGKARATKGWMNPLRLWRGRFYRIAPLYLFSVGLVLLAGFVDLGGDWLSLQNWKPLSRLLGLGVIPWHAIGRMYPGEYIANVVWTLRYEWGFYLVLPFIAWLAIDKKLAGIRVPMLVMLVVGCWLDVSVPVAVFFVFGMFSSELLQYGSFRKRMAHPAVAFAALLIATGLCFGLRHNLPAVGVNDCTALICFPVFLAAACGNSFFGLLTHPASRCLGAVSFSMYLLHGIVLSFAGMALRRMHLSQLTEIQFWTTFILVAVGLTCLCAVTYRWIESPFLSISHKSRPPRADQPQ